MKTAAAILALTTLVITACASLPPTAPVTYTCTGGFKQAVATYTDSSTLKLMLTSDDATTLHTLHSASAASGARYTTSSSTPGKPGDLVWWTKGSQATLYIATPFENTDPVKIEEKQIAVCNSL